MPTPVFTHPCSSPATACSLPLLVLLDLQSLSMQSARVLLQHLHGRPSSHRHTKRSSSSQKVSDLGAAVIRDAACRHSGMQHHLRLGLQLAQLFGNLPGGGLHQRSQQHIDTASAQGAGTGR